MNQKIITCGDAGNAHHKVGEVLQSILEERKISKLFLVCGRSFDWLAIHDEIETLPVKIVRFSDFAPNPLYEDVCRGVELFHSEDCDGILAVGGGSTIDVAKCVKLYCQMEPKENCLERLDFRRPTHSPVVMDPRQNYLLKEGDTGIPLIAVPTTAGTGSESTRFAVIYYRGEKQSITHESILPDVAVLEPAVLRSLPVYQKKCTMLDALSQGIESWWSVNSTAESREYSRRTVSSIMKNWQSYLHRQGGDAAREIMVAANDSGRAINITQTTAPHAMSYMLTSLYGLPHGHAVAVCLPEVWAYMLGHMENCIDSRGAEYLAGVLADIAHALGCESPADAVVKLRDLLVGLGMNYPVSTNREQDLDLLTQSVNPVRLKNNPVSLDSSALRILYEKIVE